MSTYPHQYIERESSRVKTERFYGDALIRIMYAQGREYAPVLFKALTSARATDFLGFLNYGLPAFPGVHRFVKRLGVDLTECVEAPEALNTPRKIFERQIRYGEVRPMPQEPEAVVSPADARVLFGSFRETSLLFLKDKFFDFSELFGDKKKPWREAFAEGDFAVCRLTPDKYHYNHTPVAGVVRDIYELPGAYHTINPGAVIDMATPFSKNKRVVTVIDTDVDGGTQAGLVAMIEIVALMIGDIVQCYSQRQYENPVPVAPGMFLEKGLPKSLYRPGSSTDVVVFQKHRVEFSDDLIANMYHQGARSRYSKGFGMPLVETDVRVRSEIGRRV